MSAPTNPGKAALVGLSALTHKEAQRALDALVATFPYSDVAGVLEAARAVLPEWRIRYNAAERQAIKAATFGQAYGARMLEDVWRRGWKVVGRRGRMPMSLEQKRLVRAARHWGKCPALADGMPHDFEHVVRSGDFEDRSFYRCVACRLRREMTDVQLFAAATMGLGPNPCVEVGRAA